MKENTLPGRLCWAGFDANGIEWMIRCEEPRNQRPYWTVYQGTMVHARYTTIEAAAAAMFANTTRRSL